MDISVLQPDYYETFHCLAGACLDNCCRESWDIPLTKNEYMKLTGARRSKELEGRMREGIKRVRRGENPSEYAHILIGPGRPCAMLGEDGLCLLQKEGGHEALGLICQSFPRANQRMLGKRVRSCSAGCEAVVELLGKKKEGIRFQNLPLRPNERNLRYGNREIPVEMEQTRPALRYFWEMEALCVGILQNRSYPLPVRVTMAAEVLDELGRLERSEDWEGMGAYLKATLAAPQLAQRAAHWEAKPRQSALALVTNVFFSFSLRGGSSREQALVQQVYQRLGIQLEDRMGEGEQAGLGVRYQLDRYLQGMDRLEQWLHGKEHLLENLMVNYYFQSLQPFDDLSMGIWENGIFFAALYSFLRFILAGVMPEEGEPDWTAVRGAIVTIFRKFTHSAQLKQKMVSYLLSNGVQTLEQMDVLIKG